MKLLFPISIVGLAATLLASPIVAAKEPPVIGKEAYAKEIKITQLLKTTTEGTGKPIVYPKGTPEVTMVHVVIPPGAQTGWHRHPVPCFAYVLEGEFTIEHEDGTIKPVKAGEALPEVIDVLHNGINRGTAPVKLIMFVAGETGCAFAIREEKKK
jgi:quercetin dioxygenase-like cupin family protein